jgi:hypothetical protein
MRGAEQRQAGAHKVASCVKGLVMMYHSTGVRGWAPGP